MVIRMMSSPAPVVHKSENARGIAGVLEVGSA